jgi:excinuclease ABC subunit A
VLKEKVRSVRIAGSSIVDVTRLSVSACLRFFRELELDQREQQIARLVIKEITDRLEFLERVGLGYLTLSRAAGTLSGGKGSGYGLPRSWERI